MKLLINPLLWYLLLQFAGLLALKSRNSGRTPSILRTLLLLTVSLTIVSMPLLRRGLESSLIVWPSANIAVVPSFIFVLGGGYLPGAIPEEDILVAESQRRVLHGVSLWRRYPNAHIVFSGAESEYKTVRADDRLVQLMAEVARDRGVPPSAILLEPRSRDTREHPIAALTLAGVTPSVPIGVVTSSWHMRRAQREFCRYFRQVQLYPVPLVSQPLSWGDLIPDTDSLGSSVTLLREWVGILWYATQRPQRLTLNC